MVLKHPFYTDKESDAIFICFSLFVEKEESQKLTYLKELGEDGEYKYVAKIDSKTSKLCHSLNGKIFKVKDMIPGVNAPPMHPWCRSVNSGLKCCFMAV